MSGPQTSGALRPSIVLALSLGAAYSLVAYLSAPSVVNGDGVGYLKAVTRGGSYPGHLWLLPLFRAVAARGGAASAPIDALRVLRVLCNVAGGCAVATMAWCARGAGWQRMVIVALGFGGAYSVWISSSDLESYAPALAALTACLALLVAEQPTLAAIAAAVATLLHVENALVGLALLATPARLATRVRTAAIFAVLVGAAYGLALGQHGLPWLGEMHHGFRYLLDGRIPAAILHGIGKAFVWAPYPYEASWPRVIALSTVGVVLAALVLGRKAALPPHERRLVLAWLVPYFVVGALYFPSDHERWIFLLPIAFLWFARAARRRDLPIVVALWAANLVVWLPVARDDQPRRRAAAVAPLLRPGDLVIGPGHGWDELVGLYERVPVEEMPLVYYAGIADLRREVARRVARAPRTLLVRLDGSDESPLGWKELAPLGVRRDNVALLLPGWRFPLGPGVELYVPRDEGEDDTAGRR